MANPVRTVRFNEAKARTAFAAYAAMRRAEADDPALRNNDLWRTLRDDAYGEFKAAYEAIP